jgi:Holliday junction DNA helicase RuvA
MIGRISGTLLQKGPPQVLVDAHGVAYEIDVPMSTFYDLPHPGERVVLLIHQVVREDAHLLYGFLDAAEREAFRLLIRISGIGPRIALSVLSGLSVADLAQAVSMQETGRLTRIPGIGKKTAERLLLELKGKFAPEFAQAGHGGTDHSTDVMRALLALGYNDREAAAAARELPAATGVSEGIKLALKSLSKPA